MIGLTEHPVLRVAAQCEQGKTWVDTLLKAGPSKHAGWMLGYLGTAQAMVAWLILLSTWVSPEVARLSITFQTGHAVSGSQVLVSGTLGMCLHCVANQMISKPPSPVALLQL